MCSGGGPLTCLAGNFQWQIWHTWPQAAKAWSSARVWSGKHKATQVKESHAPWLFCVTGEFALHGPTEVFAVWAKVWHSLISARGGRLNAEITFVLQKILWRWAGPNTAGANRCLHTHTGFLLVRACFKIERVPDLLSSVEMSSSCMQ